MSEKRRKYDQEFREGAVRIVRETGKPIAQVARDLGINEGTLGNWFAKDRGEQEGTNGLSVEDINELKRLRSENAELRMERDVLKRSVAGWARTRCAGRWAGLHMLGADRALHGAHHPALDQGEDQVHSRENLVRVQAGSGNRGALVRVALAGRRRVGRPAVGDDPAARLDVRVQERGQADRAGVGDDTQACTADPALVDLHGGREQHLPESTTAGHARFRATKE